MPRIIVALIAVAGLAAIVGLATLAPRMLPGVNAPVAAHEGFGKLPLLLATGDLGTPQAMSAERAGGVKTAAPTAAVGRADAAVGAEPMLVAPDIGVSGSAVGGGGSTGVGIAKPGMIRPMPPEAYLPPRIIYAWEGQGLPQIPAEMAVFRSSPPDVSARAEDLGRGLGLTLPGGRLTSFSYRSADGLTFSFDAGSGMLSWYREQNVMPMYLKEGDAGATLADAEAIGIANDFLQTLGLDRGAYGAPEVMRYDDPCGRGMPCMMEGSASAGDAVMGMPAPAREAAPTTISSPPTDAMPMIWPGPYYQQSVTVRYGAMLDGLPTLEWDGSSSGAVTVQVSAATRQVESGSIVLLKNLSRSLYRTQGADKILDAALHGGTNPWGGYDGGVYTPAEEAKRPVVRITLTEARLGYIQKWSDLGDGPTSYFLPVVAFRGTVVDQDRNSYPYAVIVPALDPSVFASEEPSPVPIPYGKPMPAAVDAAPPRQ